MISRTVLLLAAVFVRNVASLQQQQQQQQLQHLEHEPEAEKLRCYALSTNVEHFPIQPSDETDEVDENNLERVPWETDPLTGLQYVQCDSQTHHCYAFWKVDSNGTFEKFIRQGCWVSSGKPHNCERNQCIADTKPSKVMNNTKFCCCSGHFCNSNVTDNYVPVSEETPSATEYLEQARQERQTIIVWSSAACSLLVAIVLTTLAYHIWRARTKAAAKAAAETSYLMAQQPGYTVGMYSVDHLKLCSIVGRGKYGSVWKGIVNDQEVAVKIFPAHYRTYFYNERDIYCLPFMDNPALLTYFGCDERTNMEGRMEYLLVLSYAPNGCLQDYLTNFVLDFNTFCRMSLSVAKGLAHLHTDIKKGDKSKPCVTHRDLNSRNILVKSDLSCCICDLGFAMKISGSKYYANGEELHAESKSINEVGTRRYMAPEVLEGAVNLRDCEQSLKQIDVYALGLVLWELASRCSDFYQSTNIPPYKLPFQLEVGLHPTLEQMQMLVSRRKARPLFPAHWRDTCAYRHVRDTIEDCWDQDAEARLTALCVEERLLELPTMRDRHHRATIYSSTSPTTQTPAIINNNHLNSRDEHTAPQTKDFYDSDGTIETLLTMSPTEGPPSETIFKNSNQTVPYVKEYKQPLQPYQGRNPCLERNLMLPTQSTDDLQYNANLIDKSFKHSTQYRSNSNTESQGLITNDYLSQNGFLNRPATPIPYVQNVMYDPGSALPKQNNSGANGAESSGAKKFRWNGLRKLIDRKIFGRERLEPVGNEEEPKSNLISENGLRRDTQVKTVNGFVVTSVLQSSSDESPGSAGSNRRPSSLAVKQSDSTSGISQIMRRKNSLTKQQSLETFSQVFSSAGDLSHLKDPSQRIKTPGDVPPAVRRSRGKTNAARFSLYDDRMMVVDCAQWSSVPDDMDAVAVEPLKLPDVESLKCTRDSVSSF